MPRIDKLGAFQNVNQEEKSFLDRENIITNRSANNLNPDSASGIDLSSYLIEPKFSIDDVILPPNTKHQFSLMLGAVKNQHLIDVVWGMAEKHKLDKALAITFFGPPGTGKTIAAEAFSYEVKKKY